MWLSVGFAFPLAPSLPVSGSPRISSGGAVASGSSCSWFVEARLLFFQTREASHPWHVILAAGPCSAACWSRCEHPTLTQLCSVLSLPAAARGHPLVTTLPNPTHPPCRVLSFHRESQRRERQAKSRWLCLQGLLL